MRSHVLSMAASQDMAFRLIPRPIARTHWNSSSTACLYCVLCLRLIDINEVAFSRSTFVFVELSELVSLVNL